MDYKRREEIFSKEAIHYTEMAELLGCDKSTAGRIIRDIKRQVGDRLQIQGRIHILDYFKWVGLSEEVFKERYIRPEDVEASRKIEMVAHARSKQSIFTMSSEEIQKQYGGGK